MKKCAIIYVSIFLLNSQRLQWNCEPVIQIGNSQIIGQHIPFRDSVVDQFLGVPYAQSPTGRLRFRKPEPIRNYPKEMHAFYSPPACMQYTEKPFASYVNSNETSEDCLFLNIWTPSDASPDDRKAVLYWVHGGGYRYGSVRLPLYSGIPLAALGDIIVVTVNYRLGIFGFMTSGIQDAPGNDGLWDLLEGLRWVNKYISYFGGDTSRITIAGQSAGAWSVGLLAVSPLAEGLYNRQIMESGSPTYLNAENNTQNLAFSQRVAETVGCADTTFTIQENPIPVAECLRGIDPTVLAEADYSLNPLGSPTFFPQYGDEILPANARVSIMKGDFRCTELLIGCNEEEGSFLILMEHPEVFGSFGEKDTLLNKSMGAAFIRKTFKRFTNPEPIVQYYLPETIQENSYDFVRNQTITSIGDLLVLCPSVYHAEKCAERGGKVYHYLWTHRPSNTPWAPRIGATHGAEVQFVFGSTLLHPHSYTLEEQRMSQQINEIWSGFVKDGKPSIPWSLYGKEKPIVELLGPGMITGENGMAPHQKNCDFLRPVFTST